MEAKIYHLIFALLALLCIGADAIKCYNCTYTSAHAPGLSDTGCEGPKIDDRHLVMCSAIQTQCWKSKATVTLGGVSVTGIVRTCGQGLQTGSCQTAFGATLCVCNTDGCNGSSSTKTSLLLMFILAVVGKLVLKE